jgi:hypothetical protein
VSWVAVWIAVVGGGLAGAAVLANSRSRGFRRRVLREAQEMWARTAVPRAIARAYVDALPPPVRRYVAAAVGNGGFVVRTVRLRHGGTFRPKLEGGWLPIRGEQYFAADPPGFVWWGRARVAPGLWVDARDRSVDGVGNMHVMLQSTFTLADGSGPEIDQGALLRLLAEMTWFPTALLDERHVTWTAVGDLQARATLRVGGRQVACTFEFGADGLPVRMFADRYRDLGGRAELTPWSGEFTDYRAVHGILAPHRVAVYWHVDGRAIPYARFEVERLEYDPATPF